MLKKVIFGFLNMGAAFCVMYAVGITKVIGRHTKSDDGNSLLIRAQNIGRRYGIDKKPDVVLYMLLPFAGIPMGVAALSAGRVLPALVLISAPAVIVVMMLLIRKRKSSGIFQKNAYKLYKYILNLSAAGVHPGEAMKSMYQVVNDKKLRKLLKDACAKYTVSLDLDMLASDILNNINTPEARSFAMTIRDGLFESRDDDLMARLEQLMFNRYFAYIQRTTDNVKTRCLVSVILLCSVMVVMVLIPTFLDVQNALNSIFSQ